MCWRLIGLLDDNARCCAILLSCQLWYSSEQVLRNHFDAHDWTQHKRFIARKETVLGTFM